MTREGHPGFIAGTEGYLAPVYYVMKDAQARYERDRVRLEKGTLDPWGFLRKVRKALGYERRTVSYAQMREELIEFAETFGVDGQHPRAPISSSNRDAMKEFSQ